MKAISIQQPWASLIAIGAKRIETRSRPTPHRGPIAIHAGRGSPRSTGDWVSNSDDAIAVLNRHGLNLGDLPLGMVVAVAEIVACLPSEEFDSQLSDQERALGSYGPGRYGWMLQNVKPMNPPVAASGRLGLWEWTPPSDLNLVWDDPA